MDDGLEQGSSLDDRPAVANENPEQMTEGMDEMEWSYNKSVVYTNYNKTCLNHSKGPGSLPRNYLKLSWKTSSCWWATSRRRLGTRRHTFTKSKSRLLSSVVQTLLGNLTRSLILLVLSHFYFSRNLTTKSIKNSGKRKSPSDLHIKGFEQNSMGIFPYLFRVTLYFPIP